MVTWQVVKKAMIKGAAQPRLAYCQFALLERSDNITIFCSDLHF